MKFLSTYVKKEPSLVVNIHVQLDLLPVIYPEDAN